MEFIDDGQMPTRCLLQELSPYKLFLCPVLLLCMYGDCWRGLVWGCFLVLLLNIHIHKIGNSLLSLFQVVANAVAALSEIAESHPSSNLLDLNPQSINKLLTALNECTEWGQIFILDCLANYMPKDDREAQR